MAQSFRGIESYAYSCFANPACQPKNYMNIDPQFEPKQTDNQAISEGDDTRRGGSRIISRVLPPAIRLWLQSQVERVEHLQFVIEGRDRQILSGHIPGLAIAAAGVIYQGLYLSQVDLTATGIRINLGQILRGKPLRLKQSFPVNGKISLNEADLNASLRSPLLLGGLRDFLTRLSHAATPPPTLQELIHYLNQNPEAEIQAKMAFATQHIDLHLTPPQSEPSAFTPLQIQTGLAIQAGRYLKLVNPVLRENELPPTQQVDALKDFRLDLGTEVEIQTLAIADQCLICHGIITVIP